MTDLTEREMQIMRCIQASPNRLAGLDDIAQRMGYRPARAGRLAVARTLNGMLKRHGAENCAYGTDSKYIVRLPPRDQWDHSRWSLTDAGIRALSPLPHDRSTEVSK